MHRSFSREWDEQFAHFQGRAILALAFRRRDVLEVMQARAPCLGCSLALATEE
jgi:hypothetical protein